MELSRRTLLGYLGLGAAGAATLMANSCVPNTPLPPNIGQGIAAICAWVPVVGAGATIAAGILGGATAIAVNAAVTFLEGLCKNPPANLADVSQKVIDAISTIESALIGATNPKTFRLRAPAPDEYQKMKKALGKIRELKHQYGIK